MNLKSGALYWPRHSKPSPRPTALKADITCEVAIVGGGLSGALIAHRLSRQGIDTVVLDKRAVAAGSTSASTALVQYEIDVPLFKLIQMRGQADAVRSYELTRAAIGEIERLVHSLDDRCGFVRRSSLFLARQPRDIDLLKREFKARRKFGFKTDYLSRKEVEEHFSFSAPAALYSAEAAEINPCAFARNLLRAARMQGVRVLAPVTVRQLNSTSTGVVLRIDTGERVTAKKVIIAAGFESLKFFRRKLVKLRSSYALVTEPVLRFEGWHERCLIWDTGRPYCYLRTTADRRLMIGGGDEDFVSPKKRDALIPVKARELEGRLKEMFPRMRIKPAFQWAGTFGDTKDGLPYIGTLPSAPRVLFALCYGANGTNFAAIAANLALDWVKEKSNPDARLFAMDR